MSKSVRQFVPTHFDSSDWAQIEPLFLELQNRQLKNVADLEKWLTDFSELVCVTDEFGSRRYIDKTCHTDDANIEKAFLHWVENIEPKMKPLFFALQKKFIASPFREALKGDRYEMLTRSWLADIEVFRAENVPLETESTRLVNEYDKINGALLIDYRGETHTLQQMQRFVEEPDRKTREEAWTLISKKRLNHRDDFDRLFDSLIQIRAQIAKNAGFKDYRDYAFRQKKRFDYGWEQCHQFADAVEKSVMPVIRKLNEKRRSLLKVDRLRPWDMSVDPLNRPPLRPFDPKDIEGFVAQTRETFNRLSPQLARDFDNLSENGNLDLDSRKGKAPGGYQSSLQESRQPFIFMNAAGVHRDVETMLHEGGHAFHYLWAADVEPLVFLRHAPIEFCEVASMGMELLTLEHYDVFYKDPSHFRRAKIQQLEGNVRVLAWVATIDQFQHWIYTHPNHTRDERTRHWKSLVERFGDDLDWTGNESARDAMWQRQLHLYHEPFYYIEYAIAQLGALQLWLRSRQDLHQTLSNYRHALTLGGTRTLPELFNQAGINFDFSNRMIEPLMKSTWDELESIEAEDGLKAT